ncbi:MAG: zf-HC2 domain-containing protein [Terriglobia bacterium]|jgi:anti-sigma factor RsiW
MGCREWGSVLTDWALDELSPARARELEQHLEQCQECAHAAQRLSSVRQALKSSLIDRDMPAHVAVFGARVESPFAGFWAALFRTAALSAAAAVIFLAVVSVGFRFGGARLLPVTAWAKPALTQAELHDFVAKAVAEQVSFESKELQAATRDQVASLRQEQTENLKRFGQQLQSFELSLNTEYKETQQQSALLSVVAHEQQLPAH